MESKIFTTKGNQPSHKPIPKGEAMEQQELQIQQVMLPAYSFPGQGDRIVMGEQGITKIIWNKDGESDTYGWLQLWHEDLLFAELNKIQIASIIYVRNK